MGKSQGLFHVNVRNSLSLYQESSIAISYIFYVSYNKVAIRL